MAVSDGALDLVFVQDFAEKWLAAWHSHQPEQLLALMTDDVVYDDASWPKQMRGHAEVRGFLESTWRALPDLTFEVEQVIIDPAAGQFAQYWRATGTHTGVWDPPGLAATGRRVRFEGANVAELRDGKLCRVRQVYDVSSALRQVGILPDAGSLGERGIITVANAWTKLRRRL